MAAKVVRCEHFSDRPDTFAAYGLNSDNYEYTKYLLERVSNPNSFYYVRVDNGLLAPLLAWIFCIVLLDLEVSRISSEASLVVLIVVVTLCYLPRISQELKCCQGKLLRAKFSVKNI